MAGPLTVQQLRNILAEMPADGLIAVAGDGLCWGAISWTPARQVFPELPEGMERETRLLLVDNNFDWSKEDLAKYG